MLGGDSVDRPRVGLGRLHGSDWAQFKDDTGSHATCPPCCTLAMGWTQFSCLEDLSGLFPVLPAALFSLFSPQSKQHPE